MQGARQALIVALSLQGRATLPPAGAAFLMQRAAGKAAGVAGDPPGGDHDMRAGPGLCHEDRVADWFPGARTGPKKLACVCAL